MRVNWEATSKKEGANAFPVRGSLIQRELFLLLVFGYKEERVSMIKIIKERSSVRMQS